MSLMEWAVAGRDDRDPWKGTLRYSDADFPYYWNIWKIFCPSGALGAVGRVCAWHEAASLAWPTDQVRACAGARDRALGSACRVRGRCPLPGGAYKWVQSVPVRV